MATPASEPLAQPSSLPPQFDLMALARSLASGVQHGRHRSLARGGSAEFYDYRAYAPGDPTRLIDWRLFGRTDRAYLRRFQQESRLNLVLVVDVSASMDFAALGADEPTQRSLNAPTKKRRACELAAALAYLAVSGGDAVGLVLAGDSGQRTIPPAGGWSALTAAIRALESALAPAPLRARARARQAASQNPLAAGLIAAEAFTRGGGIVLALTDALDEPAALFEAMSRLRFGGSGAFAGGGRSRCDLAMIQILSADELDLPRDGSVRLRDPESALAVDADLEAISDGYDRAIRAHVERVRRGVIAAGGRHVLASLARPAIDVLRELLES